MKNSPPNPSHQQISDPNINEHVTYLDEVFQSSDQGIIIFDQKGLINVNPAFCHLHGFDGDKDSKEHYSLLKYNIKLKDDQGTSFPGDWPMEQVLQNKKLENLILKITRKDKGIEWTGKYKGAPFIDDTGKFSFGILYVQDITHHNQSKKSSHPQQPVGKQIDLGGMMERQRKLKGERELLEAIINTIPVMFTIYDPEIKEIVLNKAVEDISGWNNDDTKSASIMELAYPDPEYRSKVGSYMQSLQSGFRDITMRTKDGRDIATSWANVQIPDGRQVGIGIDISGRKKMMEDLIKAKEKAEKAVKLQTSFIQNVSHEVRTPMNAILGFTELLEKRMDGEKEKFYLDAVKYSGQQLLRLINDIVDFSRLDNKQLTLSKKPVYLQSIMEHAHKQLKGLVLAMKKENLRFRQQLPENMADIIIETDKDRLQQVLTNLISNAVKYTEHGYIEVGCEVNDNKQHLIFYVKDTGKGIHESDHHRVFKRFQQFDASNNRLFGGTGLGLAICKHLVRLLGGNIWFESKAGIGSIFYFSHPYVPQKHLNVIDERGENTFFAPPDLMGKTILIAEDEDFSFMMLQAMLEDTHAEIIRAENGPMAVQLFNKQSVDLVFSDIRLPGMDGYQVIEKIKEDSENIPFVALTANAMPEEKERSLKAGFHHHATKPLSMNDLFGILNRFLG